MFQVDIKLSKKFKIAYLYLLYMVQYSTKVFPKIL